MALLRQHARPMLTHGCFNGGSLFEEEILAAYAQAKAEPCVIGIGNTMKRGSGDNHPYPCKRQRRKGCISREIITSLPDHDGYQWRKYGEKKIMNNQFTRCYYRCTYNGEYKCKATKQVQQQDYSDPPIFNVTYFCNHVCPSGSFSISNNNLKSQPTKSQQILDFSTKVSSVPEHSVQAHGSKKEHRDQNSPVASINMVKGSFQGTKEVFDTIDSTGCLSDGSGMLGRSEIKVSEKEFSNSDLFSDQLIDFYEFDAMISGLENSEFVSSLFEMYDSQ